MIRYTISNGVCETTPSYVKPLQEDGAGEAVKLGLSPRVVTNPNDIGTLEVIETVKMDNGDQFKHFFCSHLALSFLYFDDI